MYSLVSYKEHSLVTKEAMRLVEIGEKHHRIFRIMERNGVLTKPRYESNIFYTEFDGDTTKLPSETRAILAEVQRLPIKQLIIAHEIPKEDLKPVPFKPQPVGVDAPKDIPLGEILTGVARVISVLALAPFALFGLLLAVDPQLIAVLDDGSETWVCLASWDE